MSQLFDYQTHFAYLNDRLGIKGAPRGSKTKFSAYLRIQPAFLSQVLAQKHSLSLEQADLANQFFDHSSEESDFFLLLVGNDRAATASLKKHFETQIGNILKKRMRVMERLGRKAEISHETKGVYYSSWLYSAAHIGCTISRLRTRKALAQELKVPTEVLGKVLDFLEENNLLRREESAYVPTESWVRLDKESPHIIKHHTNWRLKAIENLEIQTDKDLHYSGVFSIDKKTALRLKDQFLDFLKAQLKEFEAAKEEELFVIGVDFFQLMKGKDLNDKEL